MSSGVDVSVQADALHGGSEGLLRGTISAGCTSCTPFPSSTHKRRYRVIRSCLRQGFAPSCASLPSRTSSFLSMIPMRASRFLRFRILPGLVALALLAVTVACDTAANESGDTRPLNDPANPTVVTYEFEYNPAEAVGGEVDAVSQNKDNLGSILLNYGYSRDDVVSATVSEVTVSESIGSRQIEAKLYDYVSRVGLYLGANSSAPAIAPPQNVDPSSGIDIPLSTADVDVTSVIRAAPSDAFLVLSVDNTNDTKGFIEANVRFNIVVSDD